MLLLFLFVVACMAVYELLSISGSRDRLIVGALAVLSMLPLHAGSAGNFLIWVMFSPLVYLGFRVIKPSDDPSAPNEEIARHVVVLLASQIFIVLPLFYFYRLKELHQYFPAILLLAIWASDTGAYFIGRKFGHKRLAPAISPKKTYAGLFGSLLGGAVVTCAFSAVLHQGLAESILLGVAVGALGQGGDIFESIAKRVCSVKDSSALIPGHGGILDRIDSFLFSTPFLYHYLTGWVK
jgi:phosphatidate cytidylyltransferase